MTRPTLEVHIAPHRDRSDFYVASWVNDVLGSVFRLEFPGTVVRAVVLHTFATTLENRYPDCRVVFLLPDTLGTHPEDSLRDALILHGQHHREPVGSLS